MNKSISIIGSGNLAWHLSKQLFKIGYKIDCIYSKNISNAKLLANIINIKYSDSLKSTINSDIIIISISDDSYIEVLETLRINSKSILIHTSGTNSIEILKNYSENFGVLYPLQTFSKEREIDFFSIPLFIEANNEYSIREISEIANCLSNKVYKINSLEREKIHLSAIFCCNFVNYLYSCSEEILKINNFDFNIMNSLILETAQKAIELKPTLSQTGPAKRGDRNIIDKHIKLIDDKNIREVYNLLTNKILNKYNFLDDKL